MTKVQPKSPTVSYSNIALCNGNIYTMNPTYANASCIMFCEGRITFVGKDSDAPLGTNTHIINLNGRTVMPSFIDYHVHAHDGARSELYETKFDSPLNLTDFAQKIREVCANHKEGEWVRIILTSALIVNSLDTDRARQLISKASPNNPVLVNIMYHSIFANERATEIMKLSNPPPKGVIIDKSGKPTGLFIEQASAIAKESCPPFTPEQQISAARKSVEIYNTFGITGYQHAVTSTAQLDAFKFLDDAGELNLRVSACFATDSMIAAEGEGIGLEAARNFAQYRSECLRADGVKFFMDGVVPLKSAAMLEPYIGEDSKTEFGELAFSAKELADAIKPFDKMGFTVKVHAVGDRAIRETLDAFEIVRLQNPYGALFSIAHLTYIKEDDIPRLKELNVVADLNPPMWFDSPIIEINRSLLGKKRAERAYPIKDILSAGTLCCVATDWPAMIPDPNPWFGIQTLITRTHPFDTDYGVLGLHQALTLDEILPLYTCIPAKAMGWGDLTGSLEVGKSADLIILNQDPYSVLPDDLIKTCVMSTWFKGKVVYEV